METLNRFPDITVTSDTSFQIASNIRELEFTYERWKAIQNRYELMFTNHVRSCEKSMSELQEAIKYLKENTKAVK